ncbi:hypothetical protein PaecuDRAFT_0595 [Paenibacillus curdlanolyticus YK9]|uniref:Uncharacterized protein n=1 Tax=Paenibacillus curdlanolyticus YK9 TaxID=717606 RepID=E0I470_9BACL|nr:hypothetical protein PaecuDRAFT_0595 [Paenibacillus curdlanolyticus YK9]
MSEAEHLETLIQIQIAADKLSAFLQFNRADETFSCTPEALENFVKSNASSTGCSMT